MKTTARARKNPLRNQIGATMVEYCFMAALIAVVTAATVAMIGPMVSAKFSSALLP